MSKTRREKILDAAEQLFSVRGFEGVSMRMVADAAGVGLGLVTYHFASKDALFEEVISRRAHILNAARLKAIEALCDPTIEDLLAAFVLPYRVFIETGDPGWRAYARLQAVLTQDVSMTELATRTFGEVANEMIGRIMKIEPRLGLVRAVRAYVYVVGTMVSVFADTGLIARLSKGASDGGTIGDDIDDMVSFAAGGIRDMARSVSSKSVPPNGKVPTYEGVAE